MIESVRLCVETGHPIDPCNYTGPVHCTGHPEGYPCTTAMYDRREGTMDTAADRQVRLAHNRADFNCRERQAHDAMSHDANCPLCPTEEWKL